MHSSHKTTVEEKSTSQQKAVITACFDAIFDRMNEKKEKVLNDVEEEIKKYNNILIQARVEKNRRDIILEELKNIQTEIRKNEEDTIKAVMGEREQFLKEEETTSATPILAMLQLKLTALEALRSNKQLQLTARAKKLIQAEAPKALVRYALKQFAMMMAIGIAAVAIAGSVVFGAGLPLLFFPVIAFAIFLPGAGIGLAIHSRLSKKSIQPELKGSFRQPGLTPILTENFKGQDKPEIKSECPVKDQSDKRKTVSPSMSHSVMYPTTKDESPQIPPVENQPSPPLSPDFRVYR